MAGNEYVGIDANPAPTGMTAPGTAAPTSPAPAPVEVSGTSGTIGPAPTLPPAPGPRAAKANEYVGIEDAAPDLQSKAARISMLAAQKKDTDRSIQVLGLSRDTGLGPDLVDRQFDQLKKAKDVDSVDYRGMVSQAPALARFVSDPYRAAAVKDDLPALAKVEETVNDQSLFARAMAALNDAPSLAKVISHAPGYLSDAYVAKENLKVSLINMINEATGYDKRVEPFKTPAVLHDNITSNALEVGISQLEGQVAHTPGYAADLFVATRNLKTRAANAMNGPENQQPLTRTPRYMHDNAVTRYFDAQSEQASALSPEASQSTIKHMMEGNYAKAGRTAYYNLVVNAPNLAVMMTLGRLQMAAELAAYAATTTGAGAAGENAAAIRLQEDQASIPAALRDPSAAQEPPLDADLATAGAFTKGAAEALFEHVGTYLPMRAWEDAVFRAGGKATVRETIKDFSKTMLRTVFSNATEEGLTQGAQDLTDYYTGVNPDAINGIGLRMADAALIGGFTGGVLVAPAGAASGFARRAQLAHQTAQANAAASFVTDLAQAAGETKTAARDPQINSEFIRDAVEGTPNQDVLIDPDAIEKYFQSKGESPTAIMQKLGILPEFGAAKDTGTNLKIPLATFITEVVKGGHPELVNDVKFSDEALSVNEARAADQETAVAAHEAETETAVDAGPLNAKGLTAEQQFEESMQTVRDEVASQLEASGQTKEHAVVMQKILETSARRLGRDPLELYREINLRIRGAGESEMAGTAPEAQTFEQAETLAPAEGDTPEIIQAKELLASIATDEQAKSLAPEEREKYLAALDQVYGDRETRAKSMGFQDTPMYHGTVQKIGPNFEFEDREKGTFVTPDPVFADDFATGRQDDGEGTIYPASIVPVRVNIDPAKVFDPDNAEHRKAMLDDLEQNFTQPRGFYDDKLQHQNDNWQIVELTTIQNWIQDHGFEGYYAREGGVRNLSVYDVARMRGTSAAFDPRFESSPLLLAQSDAYRGPFYSKLIQTIEQKMPNAAPVDQVRAIVREVKAEEKKWLGLDDLLKGKEKVTKEEVLEHLRGNQLQVQEVTKGDQNQTVQIGATVYGIFDDGGEMVGQYLDDNEAAYAADSMQKSGEIEGFSIQPMEWDGNSTLDDVNSSEGGLTKYSQYTLPGGENYREVLFTLPSEYEKAKQEGDAAEIERLRKERVKRSQTEGAQDYVSSHWDEANILAFVRMNERVDSEGKRVLHLEEVQSDWHQDGRKHGYQGEAKQDVAALEAEMKALPETQNFSNYMKEHRPDIPTKEMSRLFKAKEGADYARWKAEIDEVFENRIRLQNAIIDANRANIKAVPDAPFRKTWHEFALKKAIAMAAEQGFDKISWTTGEQQADRYNLAKKIDRIQYSPSKSEPGKFNVIAYDLNGRDSLGGGMKYGQTEEQIAEMFGKDIAKRIVADEGTDANDGTKEKALSGLQLAVGGEGMKGFYDKIIPDYLRKFGKKFGATVGETKLLGESNGGEWSAYPMPMDDGQYTVYKMLDNGTSQELSLHATFEEAQVAARKANGTKVHSLELTTELREAALNQGFELFQDNDTSGPRGLISINRQGINIDLLTKADRSTFIHESGHFIVELMKRYSALEDTPAQLKTDFDTLMKHVGNDGGEITVEQHEELARSFEAYLMEGKAPSLELRRVFTRIKTWMVDIYRHISGLNVNLTDDVRAVFDRIIATDEEIAQAQGRQEMAPLFAEPAKYGITPEQFAEYQSAIDAARLAADDDLRAQVMNDIRKEETDLYKEMHARVTDEVTAAVNAEPVYQALTALQTGKKVDGTNVSTFGLGRFKLARLAIETEYGKDIAKALPRGVMSNIEGLHPDTIAPLFGFASGGDLIDAIRAAGDRQAVILRGVESEMNALDPKLFESTYMADAAMDAIHNEQRAKVLKLELKYLSEQNPGVVRKVTERATRRMPTDKAIREQVERIIGAKTVQEMSPNQYRLAERKAAVEAGKALTRGDLDAVFEAKRKELINHELYRAAVEARAAVQKDLRFFRKLGAADTKVSKTRDVNLVNTGRAVLAAFGIGEEGKAPEEYLASLKAYDEDAYNAAAFHVNAITEEVKGHYKSIKYDDFVAMADSVKALWDLSKSTKEIEIGGKKMQAEQAKAEMIGQIQTIAPAAKAEFTRAQSKWDKAKGRVFGFKADMTRVEGAMQGLDVNGIGPFTNYIFRPVSEAVTRYRTEKIEKMQALEKLYRDNQHIFSNKKIMAENLGPNGHRFDNKAELLMAVLHSGNDSNLRKLLVGRAWGRINEDGTLDRSKWDAFMFKAQQDGTLTKADFDFVQGVWDLNESMKAGAQRAHKQMQGYYFNEVTANEVTTAFGKYRGGYIPAKLDLDLDTTAKVRAAKEAFEQGNNTYQFPTTGRGFTKSRIETFAGPLSLNMNLLANHLDQVLRFTHIEPVVKQVARIVTDKEFDDAMKSIDGTMTTGVLVPWLQRSASQKIVMPSDTGIGQALDWFAGYIRKGISGNILVGNLTNGLQQLTGYSVAAAQVKPGHLGEAMTTYYRNPRKTVADIEEMSPWFKTTQGNTVHEITAEMDRILTDPNLYQKTDKFMQAHGQFLQAAFQNVVNPVVWLGGYNQAIAEGLSHEDAVFKGDSAVRTTQGTQNAEDISRHETGTQKERMFKYFASYFNMIYNLNQSELQKISRDVGLKKGAGRAFYLYMATISIPSVAGELIMQAMGGHIGPEDDESWTFYALRTYFGSQIKLGTAMIPYVGQIASAAVGQFTKEQYDDRLSISPVISMLESSVRVPFEVYDRVIKKVHNERKLTRDVLGLVGMLTQIPVQPLAKPINYIRDVNNRKIRPTGPIDYTRGLITGKGQKR